MRDVRSSDEHGVNVRRVAQVRGGGENIRDAELLCGLARFGRVAAGKSRNPAILGQRETGHEPPDGVQSKASDSEPDHMSFISFGAGRLAVRLRPGNSAGSSVLPDRALILVAWNMFICW
jgi:hypothetical protein